MKQRAIIGLSILFIGMPFVSFAQSAYVVPTTSTTAPAASCLSLGVNLRMGATDTTFGGWVTALQTFLSTQGYFASSYLGSGRFGPLTANAVVRFQAAHGLPATGYVGPLTRGVIEKISCGGVVVVPPTQTLSIYSLSPNYGPVGTTVMLTGYGFTNSNTILMDGSVVASNVAVSSSIAVSCTNDPSCRPGIRQTLIFTIPSGLSPYCVPGMFCAMYMRQVTPGNYTITVQNSNGTSNGQTFTVSQTNASGTGLSITGIDAPSSLTIGQNGTWTLHATAPNNAGTLHYSVQWGDQNTLNNSIMAPQASQVQTTATFTHSYSLSGTYTPIFTVTDDYGHSATVSASTVVNPIY